MFNKFQSILDLTTEKSEWSICVRAQSVWKGINRKTNTFRGYNIIFIDDQHCRIHAYINDKIAATFEEQLKEGGIYSLSSFKVKNYDAEQPIRVVRNEKIIYFDSQTKLTLLKPDVCKMPKYAFDLFSLEEVDGFLADNRFLIDVIGIIDTPNPKCVTSKEDNKKAHLKFQITDGRFKVNVTFFNEFGISFETALKEVGHDKVFIIISSAKVNKYDGETYLTNYPSTRFYLNPAHYSVQKLEKRMESLDFEEETDLKMYTVEEIKKFDKEYIHKDILCHITVKKIEEDYNWFDIFCTGCGEEITKVDGRYRCNQKDCNRNIPYPDKRFRLCTVCGDKTGVLAIIFPDDEIQRLTGKDAFDIGNDESQVGDGIKFPPLLKEFEKKEFIVTLTPSENNINKSCKIYKAKKIENPQEMGGNHDPTLEVSEPQHDFTINTEQNSTTIATTFSPPTGNSSTKTRAIKNKVPIKCEIGDDTPPNKLMKK